MANNSFNMKIACSLMSTLTSCIELTNLAVRNIGCEAICDGFWRSGRWGPLCRTDLWPRIQQLVVRLGTPSLPGPARNPFQPTLIRQESFFCLPSSSPASLTAPAPLPAQRLFDHPRTLELRWLLTRAPINHNGRQSGYTVLGGPPGPYTAYTYYGYSNVYWSLQVYRCGK